MSWRETRPHSASAVIVMSSPGRKIKITATQAPHAEGA